MPLSPEELTELGERFGAAMNARDYEGAAALYAADATYESPGLASLTEGQSEGRIVGREQIIEYFKSALGTGDFQLSPLDHFTGVNMTVTLSSTEGRTFIDVLRVNGDGLIVEHLEVTPKPSPIDFRSTGR